MNSSSDQLVDYNRHLQVLKHIVNLHQQAGQLEDVGKAGEASQVTVHGLREDILALSEKGLQFQQLFAAVGKLRRLPGEEVLPLRLHYLNKFSPVC